MAGLDVLRSLCLLFVCFGYTKQILLESAGISFTYEVESKVLSGIPEDAKQYSCLLLRHQLNIDVVSRDKAIFTIQNVRLGKLNEETVVSYAEDIHFQQFPSPHYERELSRPLVVYLDGYKIEKFEAHKYDPVWSVNIKKAILEKFQLGLRNHSPPLSPYTHTNHIPSPDSGSATYSVYEEGIDGVCETRYSLLSVSSLNHPSLSENVLNVTKVKNFKNCRNRTVFEYHNIEKQGSHFVCHLKNSSSGIWTDSSSGYESGCPFGFEPDHHPVKSYSFTKYNVSKISQNSIIEGILSEGKTVYNLNGKEIMVVAKQNITLLKKRSLSSQIFEISNPVTYESLEYQLPQEDYLDTPDAQIFNIYGPVHVSDLIQVTIRQLESLAASVIPSAPESSKNAGSKVLQLVNAFNFFKRTELEIIYKHLEYQTRVPRKHQIMRKIFLDTLAIAASQETSLYTAELIRDNRITIWEAAEMVEGIGKNANHPSGEVIDSYIKLLEHPNVQKSRRLFSALAISISKLIQKACMIHAVDYKSNRFEETGPKPKEWEKEDACTVEQLESYIQVIATKLKDSKEINEEIVYLEALAHLATPKVLSYLKPYITGQATSFHVFDDEDMKYLRTIAIYSLHHIAHSSSEKVLALVSPIYFDPSEDYDVRIAAFSVLSACNPPLTLLDRIVTELLHEKSNQVKNYVYSLLSDRANSALPVDRKMAQKIQLVLSRSPKSDLGLQYSNTFGYSFYNDDDDYGVNAFAEYVASNSSSSPKSIYMALDTIFGPFQDNVLEVGGVMKGTEELLQKLFDENDVLARIMSSLGIKPNGRITKAIVDTLDNKILYSKRKADVSRAALYFKLFGRTTYLSLDEQYAVEIMKQAIGFVRQMETTNGLTAHYVKVWMPSSFFRVVPSAVGLPVVVNHRNPVILTFSLHKARVSASQPDEPPVASGLSLTTNLEAMFHVSSIVMAYVVDPVHDELHGTALEKVSEIAVTGDIELAVNLEEQTYALKTKPRQPSEPFYHSTRRYTFIGIADFITEPRQEWIDQIKEIKTNANPFKVHEHHEVLGLSLRAVGESESPWADIPLPLSKTARKNGFLAALIEMTINSEMFKRDLHVYLDPKQTGSDSEILITANYDKHLESSSPKTRKGKTFPLQYPSGLAEDFHNDESSVHHRSLQTSEAQSFIEKMSRKSQDNLARLIEQEFSNQVPATISHILDLTIDAKDSKHKQYSYRLVYIHSLGYGLNWFELFGHHSSQDNHKPFQVCSSLLVLYPESPSPFYLEMDSPEPATVKIEGAAGWGIDCQQQKKIRLQGVMTQREHKLATFNSDEDLKRLPWYYKQCQVDEAEGRTQSHACLKAISENSKLNDIKLEFIAPHLSKNVLNHTLKLELFTKYLLYPNLDIDPTSANEDGRVTVVMLFNDNVPEKSLVDIEVHKPTESFIFNQLYLPLYEPPSLLEAYERNIWDQFYGDNYIPECNIMEDSIRTFDNITVQFPDDKCQYILAHDTSSKRAFTVTTTQTDLQAKTKALSIVLAGHRLEVLPPHAGAVPIVLDGEEHQMISSSPVILDFDEETELRAYVRPGSLGNPVLVVESPANDIAVLYGGKNAIVRIPRSFQGDLIGLCGDHDDEQVGELTGPLGCTYLDEKDFTRSYTIVGETCPKRPKHRGPSFCASNVPKSNTQESDDNSSERLQQGTSEPEHNQEFGVKEVSQPSSHILSDSSEEESQEDGKPSGSPHCIQAYTPTFEDRQSKSTCFATQPSYKCRSGCRPSGFQPQKTGFYCLRSNKSWNKLKELARHKFIQPSQNKKNEKFRYLDVPEKCL